MASRFGLFRWPSASPIRLAWSSSRAGEIFTYGHCNPYGLAFHPQTGELWESEFGPAGGDELNLLTPGHNYGRPLVSFARNYTGTLVSDQPW